MNCMNRILASLFSDIFWSKSWKTHYDALQVTAKKIAKIALKICKVHIVQTLNSVTRGGSEKSQTDHERFAKIRKSLPKAY